jgi:AraC-like DNA-binding protein
MVARMVGSPSAKQGARTAADSWRQPLFADLLRSIHLRSSVFFRPEFRAPWGISIAGHGTVFHIVVRGSCWLDVHGLPQPVPLSTGDFVVVTRGDAHCLRDAPETPTIDFFDLAKCHAPDKDRVFRAGGKGTVTRLVCGGMQVENGGIEPLLSVLPPLLHVKATEQGARPWLRLMVEHVREELDSGGAGAAEVTTRLADILFIQAVRAYFEENADTADFGWLAAVRDHQIGRALLLLHNHPQQPWTIASLADRLAISRSALAAKFTRLVGEPPLHYLTRLRMHSAMERLRLHDEKMSAIASSVGYGSVAAFNKAFKQQVGLTPGEYRRIRKSDTPRH